jgi:hypothetical protein
MGKSSEQKKAQNGRVDATASAISCNSNLQFVFEFLELAIERADMPIDHVIRLDRERHLLIRYF